MRTTLPSLADSAAIRERNLHALIAALGDRTAASRGDLALATGLSKPTVGSGVRTLADAGLVREFGRTTGRRGPSASLYELVPDSVRVLGVDLGARYTRGVLANLHSETLDEVTIRLDSAHVGSVLSSLRELRDRLVPARAAVEIAVVGSPGVVDPATGRIGSAPNLEGWEGVVAERVISDTLGVPALVENDVNLAALGEQAEGAGRGIDSFAYLAVGSGLGAGLVLGGQLHRGARGGAGEVGYLPVDDEPRAVDAAAHGGAMEDRLSSRALLRLAADLAPSTETTLTPPFELPAVFEAARAGDPLGRAVVTAAAHRLAVCVAGIAAIVDVELVLIGGGIGSNQDLLLPEARPAVARLLPVAPRLAPAALGDRAVRRGAVAVAAHAAQARVVRRLVQREAAAVRDGQGRAR